MLSVSGAMSAGAAGSYFEKEDYYLKGQENSQWMGKGAEVLGLEGQVTKEAFSAITSGCHPASGEQLISSKITKDEKGNQVETHRGGNDLTFSASKSVSVAYAAGVTGIKEAHDSAVQGVMAHIQDHYSQYRGAAGIQQADNMTVAKFDHVTSRALDPQLHSHCFLINAVQDKDGNWKANEPLNIFKDQKNIGLLYRTEMINQLQQRGFNVTITDRDQMMYELAGVDKGLVDQFSQRRETIENQVAAWKAAGQFKGLSEAKLYEKAALQTRDAKDQNITKDDVKSVWNEGFKTAGFQPEQLKTQLETACQANLDARQQQAREVPQNKTATEEVAAAAAYLTDKEAVIDMAQLLATAAKISGGQHDLAALNKAVDEHQNETGVIRLGAEKGREYYTTKDMQALEVRNLEAMKGLAGTFNSQTSRAEIEAYLSGRARTAAKDLTPDQAKYQAAYKAGIQAADRTKAELSAAGKSGDGRVILAAGQRDHIINELAGSHGAAITQGDPGSGKTYASRMVEDFNKDVLNPSSREHYTLNVAYTGKAAMEMSEASGRTAYTIDSFLNAYHSGKITVAKTPHQEHRGEQIERGEMQRGDRTAQAAEQHHNKASERLQAGPKGFMSVAEKQGGHQPEWVWQGISVGNEKRGVILRPGGKLEKYDHLSREAITGGKVTYNNITSADGTHIRSTTHTRGDSLIRTKHEQGRGTREDGSQVKFDAKSTNLAGIVTFAERREQTAAGVKITKSRTWALGMVKGTTTIYGKDGQVSVTQWEGSKSFFGGKLNITRSTTTTHIDHNACERENLSMTDRVVRGICRAIVGSRSTTASERQLPIPGAATPELPGGDNIAPAAAGQKGATIIPAGAQVVLKVDEASFVGARQAEHLINVVKDLKLQGVQIKLEMIGDTKQMQSIQAGRTFAQAQGAEGIDKAEMKEINRQRDESLKDVATTLNRGAERGEHGKAAVEALDKLQAQGRVTEIKEGGREALIKNAAEQYAAAAAKDPQTSEQKSVLLVAATNKDRQELNQAIRAERVKNGEIEQGTATGILTSVPQGATADTYKPGQVIQFSGERGSDGKMHAWGAPMQTKGEVVSTNKDNNTVQVRYQFERDSETKNVTKDFKANEMATRTTCYNHEERDFATGDRIVFGLNDKKLGVQNGSLGEIQKIDEKGNMTVRLDNDKEVNLNSNAYKQLDHAYAVTVHKSQGASVDKCLVFAPADQSATISYNALNVGVTRARDDAQVITDNFEKLQKSVQQVDEKTSTLDYQSTEVQNQIQSQDMQKDQPPETHQEVSNTDTQKLAPTANSQSLPSDNIQQGSSQKEIETKADELEQKIDAIEQGKETATPEELQQMVNDVEQLEQAVSNLDIPIDIDSDSLNSLDNLVNKIDDLEKEMKDLEQAEERPLSQSELEDKIEELKEDPTQQIDNKDLEAAGVSSAEIAAEVATEMEVDDGGMDMGGGGGGGE